MSDDEMLGAISAAMRAAFELPDLVVTAETMPADVPGWDSIANVGLALALEQRFQVGFDAMWLDDIACVGDVLPIVRAAVGVPVDGVP